MNEHLNCTAESAWTFFFMAFAIIGGIVTALLLGFLIFIILAKVFDL